MMKEFFTKKNLISLIVIPVCVWPVFNLFFFYTAFIMVPFRPLYQRMESWMFLLRTISILVSVGIAILITWLVFRIKGMELLKALALMFTLMVVASNVMRLFGMWPWLYYLLDGLVFACVLGFLYIKKKPWIYAYATIVTGLYLLGLVIFNVDV